MGKWEGVGQGIKIKCSRPLHLFQPAVCVPVTSCPFSRLLFGAQMNNIVRPSTPWWQVTDGYKGQLSHTFACTRTLAAPVGGGPKLAWEGATVGQGGGPQLAWEGGTVGLGGGHSWPGRGATVGLGGGPQLAWEGGHSWPGKGATVGLGGGPQLARGEGGVLLRGTVMLTQY